MVVPVGPTESTTLKADVTGKSATLVTEPFKVGSVSLVGAAGSVWAAALSSVWDNADSFSSDVCCCEEGQSDLVVAQFGSALD